MSNFLSILFLDKYYMHLTQKFLRISDMSLVIFYDLFGSDWRTRDWSSKSEPKHNIKFLRKKLAKTQTVETMRDTGEFSAAVFAYHFEHKFVIFCETLKVIGPKFSSHIDFCDFTTHRFRSKCKNVKKFVTTRVLNQVAKT